MTKKQNKINIVNNIIYAAQNYKNNMVGKTFMYVFNDRFIEVIYRAKDFAHLTGVDTRLSANDFYKESLRGTLRENQIYFSHRHPYNLCTKKNKYLSNIYCVTNSDLFLLETIGTNSTSYKFGITETNFTLCLDKDTDESGNPKSNFYIVKSLRAENCFNKVSNIYEVNYIFSKPNDLKFYNNITYIDRGCNINTLPQEIKSKLSKSLLKT